MKLLYTSDLHGNRVLYERLLKRAAESDIDGVVIGGDLCPRGGSTLKEWVAFQRSFLQDYLVPLITEFRMRHPEKKIFLIMGNDDFRANVDVFEDAEGKGILFFIHKKKVELGNGYSIVGYGFVNTTPFRLKDWEKKDFPHAADPPQLSPDVLRSIDEEKGTIAEDMELLASLGEPRKTIYIIHAPPFNTNLDIVTSGQHVGSVAVRKFIERHSPLATLHGHIHESHKMSGSWMDILGDTICINVGSLHPMDRLSCCVIDPASVHTATYEELRLHV
jgi:Icc-related predicted phosphoesterase